MSSPHRDAAFDAARYCIDTLKETAPIWKQEHWSAGSDWALGEHPIRPVDEPRHRRGARARARTAWPSCCSPSLASAVGIAAILLRNRRPSSMEHSIEEFERGLRALAPEPSARRRRPAE